MKNPNYEKLKEYIKKREMIRTGGHPETASFHSRGYHKYFQGWSEYRVELPNGKSKIERIYTGVYHRSTRTPLQRRWGKLNYFLLWFIAVLLFLLGAFQTTGSNSAMYVALPEALSIVLLFWVFCTVVSYCTAPEKMTLYEYRSVTGLLRSTRYSPIGLLAVAGTSLIYYLLHLSVFQEEGALTGILLCIAGPVLSAVSVYMIHLMEKNVTYESFLSDAVPPSDSIQINVKD